MKRILFTHSYFMRLDPKQWKLGQPYAPLGTLYAASKMRENGYPVFFHDVLFEEGPESILPAIRQHQPCYVVIYDDGFNYLTKMCLTNMREAAFTMIRIARQNQCTVIISSSDASDHFEKYLEAGADFVLIGEGEQTLADLISLLDGNPGGVDQVDGIVFKKDGVTVRTRKRDLIRNLDELPLPAWDLVDLPAYKSMWLRHAGFFSINLVTTRGCPYKCNWCAKPIYGNRYNARSPQNVVQELKMLQQWFGFDHVWFCDDIFGLKPGWVAEFSRLVRKEGLDFRFKIQSRADLLLEPEEVAALARAGCQQVWMGAESGSQKILDAMDKGITVTQIEKATRLLKQSGIRPSFFIQFGYLGETKEDIELTVEMISRLLPDQIGISVSYPLPGTRFYEKVKDQLKEKANWSDSDELALMFHNTYPPAYYRQLHRYVHKTFHMHLAFAHIRQLLRKPWSFNYQRFRKVLSGLYYIPSVFLAKIKLSRLENAS
ncbi:MAG: B12-binding domain-containing radical SAM protein [Flavisolibacter sp.]